MDRQVRSIGRRAGMATSMPIKVGPATPASLLPPAASPTAGKQARPFDASKSYFSTRCRTMGWCTRACAYAESAEALDVLNSGMKGLGPVEFVQ
jgi:hypothetical protein